MSSRSSPLKSPRATKVGLESYPVEYTVSLAKVPSPFPRNTPMLSVAGFVTMRSTRVSLFKSPMATDIGVEYSPVVYLI